MKLRKCFLLLLIVAALLTVTALAEGVSTPTDMEHEHYADCAAPDVCAVCGEPYTGYDIQHPDSFGVTDHSHFENDGEQCWQVCDVCGEIIMYSSHEAWCFAPGVCWVCGEATDLIQHAVPWDDGPVFGGYDADYHWFVCTECGETSCRKHIWEMGGVAGDVCVECGAEYVVKAEPTATPAPTAEPTATPAPTQKPAASGGANNVYVAPTAAPEPEDDSFLSRFQSSGAAKGELSGDTDVTLTLEANGETDYDGSVLTVFQAGSREDGVAICLSSEYEADTLANFVAWQADITTAEALRGTESFKSFVELAEALVRSLLPEKTADEADAIIVKLLQSASEGALENIDVTFGEDIDGEIVGYLAEDGYEFFLVLRDTEIELLVREAA